MMMMKEEEEEEDNFGGSTLSQLHIYCSVKW
jgi:hypothetical protein